MARELVLPALERMEKAAVRAEKILDDPDSTRIEVLGAVRAVQTHFEIVATRAFGKPRERLTLEGEDPGSSSPEAVIQGLIATLQKRAAERQASIAAAEREEALRPRTVEVRGITAPVRSGARGFTPQELEAMRSKP